MYDAVDILLVQIQHQFICERKSNFDVFYEEDVDPSIDNDYIEDDYIQNKSNISYTRFDPSVETFYIKDDVMQLKNKNDYNNFDKHCFYDFTCAQMDGGAKCSVTNIVEIVINFKWYNTKLKAPIHMKGATFGTIVLPVPLGWLRV